MPPSLQPREAACREAPTPDVPPLLADKRRVAALCDLRREPGPGAVGRRLRLRRRPRVGPDEEQPLGLARRERRRAGAGLDRRRAAAGEVGHGLAAAAARKLPAVVVAEEAAGLGLDAALGQRREAVRAAVEEAPPPGGAAVPPQGEVDAQQPGVAGDVAVQVLQDGHGVPAGGGG
jgi:hypothetical protein